MSPSPSFFREKSVLRLLERAATVAATPMSLHYIANHSEEMRLLGWGRCAACAWINEYPEGAAACARSRCEAATPAMRQDVPVTFVCHLGLTCVVAPALPESGYAITFGPYIPSELSEAVDYDVAGGLRALETIAFGDLLLPFELDDIRKAPAGVVSAVAEWLMEGLRDAWQSREAEQESLDLSPEPNESSPTPDALPRKTKKTTHRTINRRAALAALSLVCGKPSPARFIFKADLDEQRCDRRALPTSLPAHLTGLLSDTLEAAQRMGGDTEQAWDAYAVFVDKVRTLAEPEKMLHAAGQVLRKVRPRPDKPVPEYLPEVTTQVHTQYAENLVLTEISARWGVAPSTITRAVEHRIGATFSEYLGWVRMEHACLLLRNTRLSATAVGKRVGISDQSNFGKLFCKHIGTSPGKYREQFSCPGNA